MALVWWCKKASKVIEPWQTASCIKKGDLCINLEKIDDGEIKEREVMIEIK